MPFRLGVSKNDAFLFPAWLWGDASNTRSKWEKLLKAARKSTAPEASHFPGPFIDVRHNPGDIVYDISTRGVHFFHRSSKHWFLSWVGDKWDYNNRKKITYDFQYDQMLLQQGLDNLWFAIGHLGKHVGLPYLHRPEAASNNNKLIIHRMIASAISQWLPEICKLSSRITTNACTAPALIENMPQWLIGFRQTFYYAGYDVPKLIEEWRELAPLHRGNPISFLLELKLISPDGDRYLPVGASSGER